MHLSCHLVDLIAICGDFCLDTRQSRCDIWVMIWFFSAHRFLLNLVSFDVQ